MLATVLLSVLLLLGDRWRRRRDRERSSGEDLSCLLFLSFSFSFLFPSSFPSPLSPPSLFSSGLIATAWLFFSASSGSLSFVTSLTFPSSSSFSFSFSSSPFLLASSHQDAPPPAFLQKFPPPLPHPPPGNRRFRLVRPTFARSASPCL